MTQPYDSAREKLLNGMLVWTACGLQLQAWTAGTFDPAHKKVSDLVAAGGVSSSVSTQTVTQWVAPGGYAASQAIILPGTGFTVGEIVSFLTLNDTQGALLDPELILFIDDAETLPFVANGLDLTVTPDWILKRGWWRP
jgi:hypothetical protein